MRSLILSFSIIMFATLCINAQSDNCATATALGAADLTDGVATAGATTLDNTASGFWGGIAPQMNLTCDGSNTFTIDEWWRFDVVSGNDITIDITSATNQMVAIVEASAVNCGTPNLNSFLGCMDLSMGSPVTFENCFMAGSTYYIVVLTDAANQGPYVLTVTEGGGTSSSALGDVCATAIVLGPVVNGTDGATITCGADNVSGTTLNNFQEAKGSNLPQSPCIEANEATVWYSFTAGDDIYIENSTSTDLSIALYSGACGALTLLQCNAAGNIQMVDALVPGATYYVQVAYPYGSDATFNFCLNSPILPVTDNCATPELLALTNGSTTSAVQMDNFGATSTAESFTPTLISGCGAGSFSTVYYQFTIGGVGNTNLNINYDQIGASPISNSQITILLNCTASTAYNGYQWAGNTDENICLMPGTYYIQVASCDANEGNFTLALTPNTPPSNDECTAAALFNDPVTMAPVAVIPPYCEEYDVSGTTINACPEGSNLGSACSFSTEATVWYTFTTNATLNQTASITLTPIGPTAITNGTFAIIQGSCAGTLVGTCQTDGTEANIPLLPNTQYFIAVSQQAVGTPGTFDLNITLSAIPSNDDCNLATNPNITSVTNGTTNCADGEFNFCTMPLSTDHQVWYQYTNSTGANVDLGVTFGTDGSNGNSATDLSMIVFSGACASNTLFPGTTATDYCNILDAGQQLISCIEDGETIRILVGSPEVGNTDGDFTVSTMVISDSPLNDECDAAGVINIPVSSTCTWLPASGTTLEACPEDFNNVPAGCTFGSDPTVWYSFTVPATPGTYTLEFQNISGTAYLSLFNSGIDCDAPGGSALNVGCESGASPDPSGYSNLVAGTTYLIAVGDPNPGPHTFEIKVNLLPNNDECADAITLTSGLATMGTTICATQETPSYNSAVCLDTDETNTVWYEVTVGPGQKGFNLTVTGTGALPIPGGSDINAVLFETTAGACVTNGTSFIDEDCMTLATLSNQFECVGEGTYIIRISTSDANAGEFNILFEQLALVQPNDNCDAPNTTLDPGLDCTWMPAVANTTGACPEDMNLDPTNCGLDDFPVVWYQVTAPASATALDLRLVSAAAGTPFIAVFPGNPADCDNQTFVAGSTCYSGIFTDLAAIPQAQIMVTAGATYLIAIGTNVLAGSTINFEIKWITPPVNDACVNAVVMVGNTATAGTTACATQPIGGEYNSGVCTNADETNTVWYTYVVPPGDKGFNVQITASGATPLMGDINLVVFEPDPIGSCDASAGTMIDEVCTNSGVQNLDFECVGPGTYVIRISTSSANEGDFNITITPLAVVQPNDFCDSPNLTAFAPPVECEWVTVDASTVDACPETFDFASNCGFDDYPVTWYEVTAPGNAEFLDLQINSGGVTPFIAVFESSIDCDNLAPVAGSGCYSGTFDELNDLGQAQITITPGSTYLIGIGTNNVNGNIIDFGIKWITPPINDDCVDAIALTPNMAGVDPGTFTTGPIAGTTQCATIALTGSACDVNKINTVWYTYTVEADVKEITIDITNWVNTVIPQGMPTFSVAVLDGCPPATFLNEADGSTADYCGGVGVDLITLSCLDAGDVITILVSSSSQNEGTFDITLNTAEPTCVYTNDECINAEVLAPTPLDTDEDCIVTAGCNDLACSDFNFAACGATDQLNAVFYTFTTDADAEEAFVNIEITNGQAGELDSPGAVLFNGNCVTPLSIGACGSGSGGEYNSGPLGGPGLIMANTTYTVMIFNSDDNQNGGTFDLCVTVSSGCVNDLACDAYTLDPGVPVSNPASSENCTPDIDVSGCGGLQNEATLWYEVEVPEGFSYFEVTLVNAAAPDGVGGGFGEVSIAVGPLDNCNNIVPGDVIYSDCSGFTSGGGIHPIPCAIEFGTYYIQIGSEDDLDAGDFQITFTPLDDADPINDLCSQATDAVIPDFCEFFPFPGTLKGACPELNDVGGCQFSENSAVWYKITIPVVVPAISDMDLQIDGLSNPIMGVYEFDCSEVNGPSAGIISTPNLGNGASAGCVQMSLAEGIVITPGNEYYILVSSSTDEQLDFTLNIKLNAPPINDDPCIDDVNPPLDLSGGGSHTGTTCCARGVKDLNPDGSIADLPHVDCNQSTEDASVWYMFTPDPGDDGYNIILEIGGGDPAEGPMTLEVYVGTPDQGCTGFGQTLGSSCTSLTANLSIGNCFEPGEVIFVKVATDDAEDKCGDFILSIFPASCGEMFDECLDAAGATPIMPVTNPEFSIDYICVPGCLDFACPEDDSFGGCGAFTQSPTVWYHVTADDIAAQMFTTVEPMGNWQPIWSVYSGPDCDNLTVVNFGGSPPCSNGDNTIDLHQTSVFDDEENYWIAITVDPASIPATGLGDGSFELCVATTINAIICLGELEGGACDDESLVMEIEDRELDGLPLDGPFCQGEEVTINISFFYDASESGADWLIGFVPIFGPGWDLASFDYAANAPVGNGQTAIWYEEGSAVAPLIQEPNPILCTFVNADGNLQLCNQLCSPCSDCTQQGMQELDPLPSGYFWVSNGGNAGCDNDGSPGEGWGIGSITAQIDWTFTISVKEFDSVEECFDNNDLSISFQTFSDGVGGCWEDPVGECLLDRAMFSAPWMVECEAPPAVEGPDEELCHDGVTNIFVQTVDGSNNTIMVEVDDNPFVSGENDYTFLGGAGTIIDDLLNLTGSVQVVVYNVYSVDPALPCPGVINQIEVTIYPELMVTFPPVYVCQGDCIDITPDIIGGIGVPHTYVWSTGSVNPSINVCPLIPTTYFVTVTDALGCSDVGEVEVDVKPPVELLLPAILEVCKDNNFDPFNPEYMVCLDFLSGSAPYGITWNAPPGLVGFSSGIFGECFIINEQTSSAFGGVNADGIYTLSVSVTDFFGCMGQTDMIVSVTGELTIIAQVLNLECGDTEATINVTGLDAVGNPVTTFFLYGGCPAMGLGDFLEEINPPNGVGNFPPVDLLDYTCYIIVGQTESGCQNTTQITIPITNGTPIEITGDDNVCIGEMATITITNESDFTTFEWTPDIGNTGSVTFTPDSTVTYLVEAEDNMGCNSQATFEVVVNTLPVIGLAGTTTFCAGGSATITASGGTIYTWTDSGAGATGPSYTTSNAGVVTLTVENANGCISDTTVTFTEESQITVNIGGPNLCDSMADTLFVVGLFDSYSWMFNAVEVGTDSILVVTEPGTYSVDVDAGGCPGFGEITISNFISPMISVSDTVNVCRLDSGIDSLCINFNAQVTGSAGVWTQLDNIPGFPVNLSNLNNVCFEGAPTGCYRFRYATNNAQAPCLNVNEIMWVCVKACPCPSPATQPINPLCNTTTTNLNNAVVTSDPGTWSVITGPAGQDITSILNGSIFNANGLLGGDYVVRFTLNNPGGPACLDSSEQTITVFEAAMVTGSNGVMCSIAGQADPIQLDLYDLISVDASNGGTWVQTLGPTIPLGGPNNSEIMSADLSTFPDTLRFQYTTGVVAGSPCPPAVVSVQVIVRDCNCPFINVLPTSLCNNGSPIDLYDLLENPDGLAGTWTTTGNLIGASMFDPNGLPSGAYTITYTLAVSAGPNCPLQYTNTILVRRQPVAIPKAGIPPCSVDTGNGATTSNLYTWLQPGYSAGSWTQTGGSPISFTDNGLNTAIVDFASQPIGSMFTFTYTTTSALSPCTNISVPVVITVADCDCPPILLAPAVNVCNDSGMIDLCDLSAGSDPGSFTVASVGGTDFSNRITGCIFDATGLNTGNYIITFTLDQMVSGTCIGTLSVPFSVSQYLDVTGDDEAEVCSDANGNGVTSLNFTSLISNSAIGTWSDEDGAGVAISTLTELQNVSFVGVPNGVYTFLYTIDNADPCLDYVHTLVITVIDDCACPPIDPDKPADVCSTDGPIDLSTYDDPNNPGTWSSPDMTVNGGTSLVISGVTAGTYTLTYTLTNPLPDCPTDETVQIFIGEPANPGTAAQDYRLCEGIDEVVSLDGLLTGADDNGVWTETSANPSTGFDAANATFSSNGQAVGMYSFEYTISGNAPCPDVDVTVRVVIEPNPISDAGNEKFIDCDNTTATIGGTGTTTGTGITYTWVNITTGNNVGTGSTTTVTNAGTFELTVLNTATGCQATSTVEVTKSDDLPTMDIEAKDITCFGDDDGGLTVSNQQGGDGNYTYSLNGGAAISDPSQFGNLPAGDYSIVIMDGNGCSQEYTFTILEPNQIFIDAGPAIVTGNLGDEFVLTVLPFDTTGITSLIWSDLNTGVEICNGLGCTSITVIPTEFVTTYYVEAMDANGCTAFDNIQVQLNQIVDVTFPNIITPNGDNVNDRFFIASDDVESIISMKVFDRWGEKIYDARNIPPRDPSVGWDGKFNGKKVVPGVYVFIVELAFFNESDTKTFSGDVTVTDSE